MAKRLRRFFFIHVKYDFINHDVPWKDVQGCKKQLHFYQNNEYHFLENIPHAKPNFTTSPQVFQYLKLLKLNFLNSKNYCKSAVKWSIISEHSEIDGLSDYSAKLL